MNARADGRVKQALATLGMAALAWATLPGCVDEGTVHAPALDADRYALEVQPFVAASCATLDCHGVLGRPLRLYSELGLRLSASLRPVALDEDVEPEPLTAEELADNVDAFRALHEEVRGEGEQLALSKPLSQSAGGGKHAGGDLFDSKQHPGYLCLQRWLSGLDSDAGSCSEALDAVPNPQP